MRTVTTLTINTVITMEIIMTKSYLYMWYFVGIKIIVAPLKNVTLSFRMSNRFNEVIFSCSKDAYRVAIKVSILTDFSHV